MPEWLMLVTNLPGRNQTLRMRIWRALKAAGAGSLRDGVYVLPHSQTSIAALEEQAREVRSGGGSAQLLAFDSDNEDQRAAFSALFDRTDEYSSLLHRLGRFVRSTNKTSGTDARRELAVLKREAAALVAIDFFPGNARGHLEQALTDAEVQLAMRTSPDEPHGVHRAIDRRATENYRGRLWVTRKKLWIDRICSAWLIRRFIDSKAKFRWLDNVKQRPARAIGFDFDGAEFSHVDGKVTFEVLAASFSLDRNAALSRLGHVVHYLDVGGVPVPEAAGLAAVVTGARARCADDDEMIEAIFPVLDLLYAAFTEDGDDEMGDDDATKATRRDGMARRSTRARNDVDRRDPARKNGARARGSRSRR